MRIGMVCPYSFDVPGGVQAHALDLSAELRSRGHEVSVIGPCSKSTAVPGFVVRGGGSIPVPYNGSVARLTFGPTAARRVRRWLREGGFDVLHLHEPNAPSYSMLALHQATGPVVATYHSAAVKSGVLTVAEPLLRPMLEKIRAGIAVSDVARRWQVERLGGDPLRIPNGVHTAHYGDIGPVAGFPELGALLPDRPRVAFLGRFDEPRKGMAVLAQAWPGILARCPQAELVVIGDGDADRVRRSLGPAAGSVHFLGRLETDAKAAALAASDIYVAPQRGGESFGIVLVEAMAAGTPVVASDLEAFRAVLDDGRCGRLFANGNAAALGDAVVALLSDPGERSRLIAAGRRRARSYDWSTVTGDVVEVYRAVRTPGEKVTVGSSLNRVRRLHSRAELMRELLDASMDRAGADRADSEVRVEVAGRLHNDAVAAARRLRRSRGVRLLRLARGLPEPQYVDLADAAHRR